MNELKVAPVTAGERLVSAERSPIARCDDCRRFAVPGQLYCTEHLTPKREGQP